MSSCLHPRNGADLSPAIAGHTPVFTGKDLSINSTFRSFCFLAVLTVLIFSPCRADVPTPPAPPPVPAGYCNLMYGELYGDLQAFNTVLATPPAWTPIPGGPPVYAANLHGADANLGSPLGGPGYFPAVQAQLQELQAMGVQAIVVGADFPIVYEPFFGSPAATQPYLDFYSQVAQAVRAAGLVLIVDDEIILSNDVAANWTNVSTFYNSLTWPEYMAAKASMAATLAQLMQPDYMVLSEEPDTEANQTGQQNVLIPADAAQMVAGEIAAVRALNLPIKLGAGSGSWQTGLTTYISDYVALDLDYIDFHLFPINTESGHSFIGNTLVIAQMAAAAGKPVATSQTWTWKMENSEWGVLTHDTYRARNAFSFWAPLDEYFQQTLQALANYTNMLYVGPEGPDYLFTYQTYGGTTANGGAANCTCTTASCSDYDVVHTEDALFNAAISAVDYSTTGLNYYNLLVPTPDTTPPSTPTKLTGKAGYDQANITWTGSTDNVGVAGYNVYRCSPPAVGQSCTEAWIANTALPSFTDINLTSNNTPYNYQVQAFDLANNNSALTPVLSLVTLHTSTNAPSNLVATAVSPKEIDLSWDAPSAPNGTLGIYVVYSGSSPSTLQPITNLGPTKTSFRVFPLSAGTAYWFAVEATEAGVRSPMSPIVSATTLPLPNPPSNVTATPSNSTRIAVNWQETVVSGGLPVGSYQVYQGTIPGRLTDKVRIVKAPGTSYTAANLTPNTTYYFEIVAADTSFDYSDTSIEVSATTPPLPPPPTDLAKTTPSATKIALTWDWAPLPGGLPIARYLIDCGPSPASPPQVGITTLGPSFTWNGASAASTYYCQVIAVDSANDQSKPSSQITVTTPPLPAAPTNVVATADSGTKVKVTVTWSETIPTNGLPIQTYAIYRGISPNNMPKLTNRSASPFVDVNVVAGTTYYYAIQAVDTGNDDSPLSATATVTTP